MTLNEMHEYLVEALGIPDEAVLIVCAINGYNEQTMKDILYVDTGYRGFDQHKDEWA